MNWIARLKIRKASESLPTKTTEKIFVVSVGSPIAHLEKISGAKDSANDPVLDLDRYCWPYSTAMSSQEIETFKRRFDKLITKGLEQCFAEKIADQLVKRDRDGDDRRFCLECKHLSRYLGSWRCSNWKIAGVAFRSKDAQIPVTLIRTLQRCIGWQS